MSALRTFRQCCRLAALASAVGQQLRNGFMCRHTMHSGYYHVFDQANRGVSANARRIIPISLPSAASSSAFNSTSASVSFPSTHHPTLQKLSPFLSNRLLQFALVVSVFPTASMAIFSASAYAWKGSTNFDTSGALPAGRTT
ncbi:hypothetical protein CC80DRAFT_531879 [Byssothecium circinans]|uniref:Uncharacterized protein n=1 Tax=Byssothecium circinans TaxID=147558 RepID=A0A6A5UJB1_9PLEO|nr:hypothetical protein CC80DRAFT_531879 [Byssothecium circinans]